MEWFVRFLESLKDPTKPHNITKVIDIGSCDVNGSYKPLFNSPAYKYTGADIAAGKNVDIVLKHPYFWSELKDESFDVVISGQTLEHTEFFWVAFGEMVRICKRGGLICIIVPRGFYEHRYPVDCWRFLTDGMVALCRYYRLDIFHAHTNCAPANANQSDWCWKSEEDTMLIAAKGYTGVQKIDLVDYQVRPADQAVLRGDMIQYGMKL